MTAKDKLTPAQSKLLALIPDEWGLPERGAMHFHNATFAKLIEKGVIEWSGGTPENIWQLNYGTFRRTAAPVYTLPDTSDAAGAFRLWEALRHPETLEDWPGDEAALAEGIDPDEVTTHTEPVSEWQDARNSRPEPY